MCDSKISLNKYTNKRSALSSFEKLGHEEKPHAWHMKDVALACAERAPGHLHASGRREKFGAVQIQVQ